MPIVQYIGSDPTWGPQQQVARRHAIEQTSVTLGLGDADPTVRGVLTGGNPYQQHWRDSTISAVSNANQQWVRKRLNTTDLGLADSDPTVRPPWADGSAYLRPGPRQPDAVTAQQWLRRRLNTTDLGLTDADATVKPPWADGSAYLRPSPRQPDAITANNAWRLSRLTGNDLGATDADATVKPPWADGSAYLWPAPRQPGAVSATNQWARKRLSTNELGTTDADPTIKPPYQDPHQRRHLDPAYAVQPTLAWLRLRLTTNDLGVADQDTTIRPLWQAANPYTLRLGPSPLPAIEANLAERRTWTYPVEDSTDFIRPVYQDPYQRRRTDPATWTVEAFTQWMRRRILPERIYDPFDPDPCIIQDEAGNPILDEAGNDLLIESCGPTTDTTLVGGGKWDITRADRDALDRRRKQETRQRMLLREDEEILVCL